jgi:hypothetical protein
MCRFDFFITTPHFIKQTFDPPLRKFFRAENIEVKNYTMSTGKSGAEAKMSYAM